MKSNHFLFTISLLAFVLVPMSFSIDSNGIWHYANDVRPGTFGSDEYSGDYSFTDNVGIGTTSPDYKLHVVINDSAAGGDNGQLVIENINTAAGANSNLKVITNSLSSNTGIQFSYGDFATSLDKAALVYSHTLDMFQFHTTKDGSEWSPKAVLTSDGKFGIGTPSPDATLHIVNPNSGAEGKELILESSNATNGAGVTFKNSGIEKWAISARPDGAERGQLSIFNMEGPTKVLTIETTGNVGIGTTAPAQKLDVAGKIRMQTQTQITDSDDTVATKGYVDTRIDEDGVPTGAIMMFAGPCPVGWSQYVALTGKFPRGGNPGSLSSGGSDNAVAVSHSHAASTSSSGSHSHSGTTSSVGIHNHAHPTSPTPKETGSTQDIGLRIDPINMHSHTFTTNTAGSHSHLVSIFPSGESGIGKNVPSYQEVVYCIKN